MSDTAERLVKCFAAVFPRLNADEIRRASMTSVGAWDSMASVRLLGVLEEEFGISIDSTELERFVSFPIVLDYLQDARLLS